MKIVCYYKEIMFDVLRKSNDTHPLRALSKAAAVYDLQSKLGLCSEFLEDIFYGSDNS